MAYVVLESSVRTHRKMLAAGPAACWLWTCGLGYCQEGLTDGHIPEAAVEFLGVRDAQTLAAVLVQVKLWNRVDDGWQVHDYHEHNKPAEEIRRIMRARQQGGKLGGRPPKPTETLEDNLQGSKKRNLPRNPSGTSGTSVPSVPSTLLELAPPPLAAPPSPPVLTFPTTGVTKTWNLAAAYVAELQIAYEAVDILAEARKALTWVNANPTRKKTAKGMPAFLVNWLNTSVRRGDFARRSAVIATAEDWQDECRRMHGGTCPDKGKHYYRARMSA